MRGTRSWTGRARTATGTWETTQSSHAPILSNGERHRESEMLSATTQATLLRIARESVIARVTRGVDSQPPPLDCVSADHSGAFVTLTSQGGLRGCIGNIGAAGRLEDVVCRCAAAAATEDPRFPPLTAAELDAIDIEVSVLSPAQPVRDPAEIEVGRDGLIVELGARRGLLLPQVATEWGWDRYTFLGQACVKAGLAPDAWRLGARVFRFEAEVFGERSRRAAHRGSSRPTD